MSGRAKTKEVDAGPRFSPRVYALVAQIPPRHIVSYGAVAAMLGKPRAARAVGQALRALPDGHDLPWWRVVNARGSVSDRPVLHAKPLQQKLLRKEGVRFDRNGCASWEKYGWNGPAEEPARKAAKASDHGSSNRKNPRQKSRDH